MANEIQYRHYDTGDTLYAAFQQADGTYWNETNTAFETVVVADWNTNEEYGTALTESPASSQQYQGNVPANLPTDSLVRRRIFVRLGGTQAITDYTAADEWLLWHGASFTAVPAKQLPGRVITTTDGVELVTNGEDPWTGATGTTPPNGWSSYVDGAEFDGQASGLKIDVADGTTGGMQQTIATEIGVSYRVTGVAPGGAMGTPFLAVGITGDIDFYGEADMEAGGTFPIDFIATTTATTVTVHASPSGFIAIFLVTSVSANLLVDLATAGGQTLDTKTAEGRISTDLFDAHAELAGVPAANASLADKVEFLLMRMRNKQTSTSSAETVANDAGATIATAALADDGTTTTKEKFV